MYVVICNGMEFVISWDVCFLIKKNYQWPFYTKSIGYYPSLSSYSFSVNFIFAKLPMAFLYKSLLPISNMIHIYIINLCAGIKLY
jgi:hypothetical protein